MSFTFGPGEPAPLLPGAGDTTLPHPNLAEVEERMSMKDGLPAFIHSVEPVLAHPFGDTLGLGWRYAVALAPLPLGSSPYAVGDHMYKLHVTMPPEFPATVPVVRFTGVMYHSQIPMTGTIPDHLLQPRWESATSTVWDLLEACRHMLLSPLSTPALEAQRNEEAESLTDEVVRHFWKNHEADCTCFPGRLLPCSYEDFCARPDDEQAQMIKTFRAKMRQIHLHDFEGQGSLMRRRLELIRSWEARTTFPELLQAGKTGWRDEWFHPDFRAAIETYYSGSEGADTGDGVAAPSTSAPLRALLHEEAPGIYSLPIFTPEFCALLMRELRAFEASELPKTRPNSMNNYGQILNDMGLEGAIDVFVARYVQPVVRLMFLHLTGGHPVDHHHSFVVEYKEGRDVLLDMHTDDSEVTVNVNLNDQYEGSGLSFCGLYGTTERRRLAHSYGHRLGYAVVHAGLHTHGADVLTKGERHNMIIWCKSATYRTTELFFQRYQKAHLVEEEPDLRCLSRTHDRDYNHWASVLLRGKDGAEESAGAGAAVQ